MLLFALRKPDIRTWLLVIIGGAALLFALGPHILHSMGVPVTSPLYAPAFRYLSTRCWAAPVVLSMFMAEGIFRGHGNTVVPLTANVVSAVMNIVLDPFLMFGFFHWGIQGAAAAITLSQMGAATIYAIHLLRRNMVPQSWVRRFSFITNTSATKKMTSTTTTTQNDTQTASSQNSNTTALPLPKTQVMAGGVIRSILEANVAMLMKQGSLLGGWAYATARATRLGATHVAAHQVALSIWLIFAILLDGASVSAHVLMSRAFAAGDRPRVRSLTNYKLRFAVVQGLVSTFVVMQLDSVLPRLFTPDPVIQTQLHALMRPLALQQMLISLTLVLESMAAGANEFRWLAVGTTVATLLSVYQISQQTSVVGIWMNGIMTMFIGRLISATLANVRLHWRLQHPSSLSSSSSSQATKAIHID